MACVRRQAARSVAASHRRRARRHGSAGDCAELGTSDRVRDRASARETQLVDLHGLSSDRNMRSQRTELRRSGRSVLAELGIDPVRHAYFALDALSVGRVASKLTAVRRR